MAAPLVGKTFLRTFFVLSRRSLHLQQATVCTGSRAYSEGGGLLSSLFGGSGDKELAAAEQETQDLLAQRPTRKSRAYQPPPDLQQRLEGMAAEIRGGPTDKWRNVSVENISTKFQVLSRCYKEFGHEVPSNELANMKTFQDVLDFYKTAVVDADVYNQLIEKDLPPNVNIQWDAYDHLVKKNS
ncbi:PREDICTED: 39S ribosomal protein L50, mitochondrial-like [Branchiostoma belcheri]|uniref:Large ribosomal subunit protein mL50 n=1 Tax=Branchiostoma belcheri TaxID=7741 RepID=A0A6P4YUP9_BRABE|nr:PREDICTED: 39S ribosomal protein L50, mitochondrial-like [Branchiostoma belcheri]